MGVDASEYTGDPMGAGRIHIFTGGDSPDGMGGRSPNPPTSPQSYTALWNTRRQHDGVRRRAPLVRGEPDDVPEQAAQQVLFDYTNMGGRVFASHYHYSWFIDRPRDRFSTLTPPLATWQTTTPGFVGDATIGLQRRHRDDAPEREPFPEGASLKQWLPEQRRAQQRRASCPSTIRATTPP